MEAFSQKDYQKARYLLKQSAAELPDNASIYLGLALTYEQLGDLQSAQVFAQKVSNLEPNNFTAINLLSRIQIAK